MRNIFFVLLLFVFGLETWGQTPPVITGLEKPNGFPLGTMVITGSGFDADPANLSVWLGGVEANVISSEENLIAITIPAMAQADNVTVINLATKKSAKSNIKAFSSFSGTGFDPVNLDAPVKFTESLQLFDLCACDINRDGKADIAITKFNAPLNSLKVLINESTPGNINFSAYPTNISINAPTADINCGDLNGDGWPELIATKGGSGGIDRNAIYIFPNNAGTLGSGIGLFLPAGTVTSEKVAIRDLNFDGLPELVITNSKTGELFLFKNTSTPTAMSFAKDPQIILLEGKEGSVGLEIQDLNDDQRPEIIVTANANFATDIIVLENTSTADQVRFKQLPPVNIDYLLSEIITVDFTNDGLLDVAASSLFSNKVVVLINKSSGGTVDFELPREFDSSGASGLSIADLDGDNLIDLLVSDTKGGSVAVFKNTSVAPAFDMQRIPVPVSNPTRNVLANDFDGDGKPDIAFTSEGGATFSVEILRNKHCYIPVLLGDTPLKICPGQTIPVKAIPSPGSTFAWSDGSSGTDPFYNMTAAGTISVTVTQEGGTCSNTSNVITFVDGTGTIPTPPVIPKIGTVCVGGTINLSATGVTDPTAQYYWTGPGDFSSTDQNPIRSNATADMAGIYTLKVSLGECLSSEVITSVEVFAFPTMVIDASAGDGFCIGQTNTLSVENFNGYSYQWTQDGLDVAGGTTTALDVTTPGLYSVKVTNDLLGCVSEVTPLVLSATDLPVVDFTTAATSVCAGEELIFTNTTSGDPAFTLNYLWDFGDGTTMTTTDAGHLYALAGSYTVTLNAEYEGFTNCGASFAMDITVSDAIVPVITAVDTTLCLGESVELTVAGTYTSYLWSTGETTASITVDAAGNYFVDTQDAVGCPGKDYQEVVALATPDLTVIPDTTLIAGDTIRLYANGADTYEWLPAESLDNPFVFNPLAQPDSSTVYQVIGYSADMCMDTAYVTVGIQPGTIVPRKAFSPNGDTIDDYWVIKYIESYSSCTVRIFDRRGMVLYEKSGYANDWDGTYNGKALPMGAYYYVITCPDDEMPPMKGSVLVVR